jgi:hypothetical protein
MFVHQAKRARGRAGLIALPLAAFALLVFGALPASARPTTRAASQASMSGAGVSGPIVVDGPTPGSVTNCDGRREAFRVAGNRSVEYRYQISPNGAWTQWINMGGTLLYGDLSVGLNGDCKIELLVTGTDHAVWTRWQTNPGGGPWAPWTSIGGYVTGAPGTVIISGTLSVCANYNDLSEYCNRHTQPYGSPWSGWFEVFGGLS